MPKVPEQIHCSPCDVSNSVRLEIAQHIQYYSKYVHSPYHIEWDGAFFTSSDTKNLVDKVLLWLQKTPAKRAQILRENK